MRTFHWFLIFYIKVMIFLFLLLTQIFLHFTIPLIFFNSFRVCVQICRDSISNKFKWLRWVCWQWQNSRKNGGQREEFCRQVGQVNQQEDEQRLYDAHLLCKTSDKGQNNSKDETNQSPSNADNEEGDWNDCRNEKSICFM